ncbi:hypothetical protein EES37_20820 [Streptomyces sp. ADI91-18]|nr:hypothetical protein EES37_20820 [Streptomyces sp. ADI91-18]
MAGRAGVGEAFHQQHAGAFAPGGAVGARREGLAAAVGGEAALAAEGDERAGAGHDRDAAGEREGALAAAQGLDGEVQGGERGGAGGVDGDRGAFEAEGVSDAAGGDARGVAGDEVSLEPVGGVLQSGAVFLGLGADEYADLAAAESGGVDAGPVEGLPGGFQEEALLGVHGEGFARGYSEECGVEFVGVVEESAFAGVRGAGAVGVGVVKRVEVPAAPGGEFGDGVGAVRDEFPERFGGMDVAGEAAADADDGDGFVAADGGGDGCLGGGGQAQEQGVDPAGEVGGGGVVEGQGDRQAQAGAGDEPGVQVDGGERVEAEVEEGALRVQGGGCGVAEGGGDEGGDPVEQRGVLFGLGQPGQPLAPSVGPVGTAARAVIAGLIADRSTGVTVAVGRGPGAVGALGFALGSLGSAGLGGVVGFGSEILGIVQHRALHHSVQRNLRPEMTLAREGLHRNP